ncbi:plasmid segregation protein ParM [Serratia sp. UGAL515B_01]|uniref:plasmid segregation protein ParM n=1 Tax=Serratia sp. UGAL515B_01 TaxID=2986763 RepID=UPI00295517A3|nr:plasmid segregation protein ParM [Serratia sp. UGAL515B_01]WON75559.1 plasmid segregation protein ParM [Serratia sp. UGAL515B_01]
MRIYVDDGSTNIKLAWKEGGVVKTAISPNSFKPEWSLNLFDNSSSSNYEIEGEKFSFDPTSADAVVTTETRYQYSLVNVVAIHHALLQSGIEPQKVDIVVTLPLSEYLDSDNQPNKENIARKKASVKRTVAVQGKAGFAIDKVSVLPESIPAGFNVLASLEDDDSLLIVDLGGTTLDVSHVRSKMRGITKTWCDPKIGVSIVTDGIKNTLAANTRISSLHADNIIINRNDTSWLEHRMADVNHRKAVMTTIEEKEGVLTRRVTDALTRFTGYTHVMCVGGGAGLVKDAVKFVTKVPENRFFSSKEPQFDLVLGMLEMKEGSVNE